MELRLKDAKIKEIKKKKRVRIVDIDIGQENNINLLNTEEKQISVKNEKDT